MRVKRLAWILSVILSVSCFEALAGNYTDFTKPYDPDADTVMLLHFDEGTGTTVGDSSPNAMTGIMSPDLVAEGAGAWVDGQAGFGKAILFDSTPENSKFITFPQNGALGVGTSTDLTMECWMYRYAQGNLSQVIAIGNTGADYYWEINSAGYMVFEWYTSGWKAAVDYDHVWPIGEWIHAAVTTNRSAPLGERYVKFWMNGQEIYSTYPNDYAPYAVPGPLYIGASGDSYSNRRMLCGTIDEFRISKTIRNLPVPGSITGIVSLQNFNYGQAPIAVRIELIQNDIVVRTEDVLLDFERRYTIDNADAGTYSVRFKASSWLRTVESGIVVPSGSNVTCNVTLLSGDIDGNNQVTPTDVGIVLESLDAEGK